MDKIRLLIVADNASGKEGLQTIFAAENNFKVLGGLLLDQAVQESIALQPDVILFDVTKNAPDLGSKISEIKSGCLFTLMLLMVSGDRFGNLFDLLDQGLDGIISKDIMRGCLVNIVELACRAGLLCLPLSCKRILAGQRVAGGMPAINIKQINESQTLGDDKSLTKREMEILHIMADNYSNRQIAQKLFISESTVKTHVSQILRKLGQKNRAQAVLYSYKIGLLNDKPVTPKAISE